MAMLGEPNFWELLVQLPLETPNSELPQLEKRNSAPNQEPLPLAAQPRLVLNYEFRVPQSSVSCHALRVDLTIPSALDCGDPWDLWFVAPMHSSGLMKIFETMQTLHWSIRTCLCNLSLPSTISWAQDSCLAVFFGSRMRRSHSLPVQTAKSISTNWTNRTFLFMREQESRGKREICANHWLSETENLYEVFRKTWSMQGECPSIQGPLNSRNRRPWMHRLAQ